MWPQTPGMAQNRAKPRIEAIRSVWMRSVVNKNKKKTALTILDRSHAGTCQQCDGFCSDIFRSQPIVFQQTHCCVGSLSTLPSDHIEGNAGTVDHGLQHGWGATTHADQSMTMTHVL